MEARLEELNRDLTNATNHSFPENYVRKALLAHGYFAHSRMLAEHKQRFWKGSSGRSGSLDGAGISEDEKRITTQLVYHFREGKEFHTLKEPLKLTYRQKPSKNLPLWPAEVECVALRVQFLWDYIPAPEPYYKPEQPVIAPKIRSSEGNGLVVYMNIPGPEKYFTMARIGPSVKQPPPCHRSRDDPTLVFESRFESGNLAKAVQVGRWDYELYLRFDLYTQKHTQWFFFSVGNMRAGQTYRFTIVNLYKASSLYKDGMQPVMFSEASAGESGRGWHRVGFNIKYFKTDIRRVGTKSESYYYALTWSYKNENENDLCYFAHCYPYTYSELQDYLQCIQSDPIKSLFCKQRILCYTLAGNPVPLLTITSHSRCLEEAKEKKVVVVTARVHPGETNGSWMMKGLLDFLVSENPDAQVLRDAFVFKIIPMLNPDGVIVGNYRCSLAARDLNRNYTGNLRDAFPTIEHTKELVKKLVKEREVVMFCDLHGHSRKQNVFMYGCDECQDPKTRLHSRVFPRMMSKNVPTKFSYKSSSFKVQRSKEGTGRVFMWREMGITNSYTMEATFCGSNLGRERGYHFSIYDLERMGYHFCDTLLDYCDPDQTKVNLIMEELKEEYRQSLARKLPALGFSIPPDMDLLDLELTPDMMAQLESSDEGSDSSESDGPPMEVLVRREEKKKKRKKLKTRKERNKKAQIKLTHKMASTTIYANSKPNDQPTMGHKSTLKTDKAGAMEGRRTDGTSVMDVLGPTNIMAANSGVPKFVQERIEDRQRKMDYVESVTLDYMRSGMPQSVIEGINKELRSSTASLQPVLQLQDCPMSITALAPKQASQSKVKSLPTSAHQLLGTTAKGAFASQYIASHLQHLDAGREGSSSPKLQPLEANGSKTKNLVSLSRFLRQMKPHLLQSANRGKVGGSRLERKSADSQESLSVRRRSRPSRLEYVGFDGYPVKTRKSSESSSEEKAGWDQPKQEEKPKRPTKLPAKLPAYISDMYMTSFESSHAPTLPAIPPDTTAVPTRPTSSKSNDDDDETSPLSRSLDAPFRLHPDSPPLIHLTHLDRKLLSELRTSYHNLAETAATNSRSSISSQRMSLPSNPTETSGECRTRVDPSYLLLMQPPTTSLELNSQNCSGFVTPKLCDGALLSRGSFKMPALLPSKPAPDISDTTANNVLLYKKHSGEAMEILQQQQQQRRRQRAELARDPDMITHPPVNWKSNQHSTSTDRQPEQRQPAASYSLPQSQEGKRRGHTHKPDQYTPMQVFSSKPPTRHGFRPAHGEGVAPSTVSLMLREGAFSQACGSKRRLPGSLHLNHHTSQAKNYFSL